jgi:hypothetical protein
MRAFPTLAALIVLAACVRPSEPEAPAPEPRPVPRPVMPAPVPLSSDWRDWPITPGTWTYRADERGSLALFGEASTDARFVVRCDRTAGRVYLSRAGDAANAAGGSMTVRTTSLTRAVPAQPTGAQLPYLAAALTPRDPLLDAMAFSRGRFIVELGALPKLAIPAWAEVARVIEDCR